MPQAQALHRHRRHSPRRAPPPAHLLSTALPVAPKTPGTVQSASALSPPSSSSLLPHRPSSFALWRGDACGGSLLAPARGRGGGARVVCGTICMSSRGMIGGVPGQSDAAGSSAPFTASAAKPPAPHWQRPFPRCFSTPLPFTKCHHGMPRLPIDHFARLVLAQHRARRPFQVRSGPKGTENP